MEKTQDEIRIQSHNMSVKEVRDIGLKQAGSVREKISQVPGNRTKALKDKYFIEDGLKNYMVDEHEQHVYHVAQETRSFNAILGTRLSSSLIQKYTVDDWKFMNGGRGTINVSGFIGMTVEILHDPTFKGAPEEGQQDDIDEVVQMIKTASPEKLKGIAESLEKEKADIAAEREKLRIEREQLEAMKEQSLVEANDDSLKLVKSVGDVANESMTISQLSTMAEEHNIDLGSASKKADILAILKSSTVPFKGE
jgi:hypothetical protein